MADTIAYILITAELGAAADVAAQVSALDSVHWAAVVTGPYDIIAGVRVSDNEVLGKLVLERIQTIAGVTETMTAVVSSFHQVAPKGIHGPP
jgi:DNA-binding Lrp family transcriptional regulator